MINELLVRQGIWVNVDQDRVVLSVGRTEYPMPYAQAFKIGGAMRVGARRLMQMSGEKHSDWMERSRLDFYSNPPEISQTIRKSRTVKYDWRLDLPPGEILQLWMDGCLLEFHFEAALKLSEWLRIAGKSAKKWAGDTSTVKTSCGILSDAEYNYKHGLNRILN